MHQVVDANRRKTPRRRRRREEACATISACATIYGVISLPWRCVERQPATVALSLFFTFSYLFHIHCFLLPFFFSSVSCTNLSQLCLGTFFRVFCQCVSFFGQFFPTASPLGRNNAAYLLFTPEISCCRYNHRR